jgi:hypothetical protein
MGKLGLVQKRFIALYRPSFLPWTQYELTSQPELAKECEERVVAAYKANDADEARMQFHRYRSIGVMPSTETWHKFLLIAYKEGNIHDIQSLFYTLRSFGVNADVTAWNFLLDILSKRGLVRKSEEIFWSIMQETYGRVNEFTLRTFFNCLLQEKRYLRAMIAYAGLKEYGFSIDADSLKILEDFCHQHIKERPGGIDTLNVPVEDLPIVQAALRLDAITFGHSNVLACSDNLSSAGRDAVLTWYAKRATDISVSDAFKIVYEHARLGWDIHTALSIGADRLCLSVLREWMQVGDLRLSTDLARMVDERIAQNGPYFISSFNNPEGLPRAIFVSKSDQKTYHRLVVDANGTPLSEAEAAATHEFVRASKTPIAFLQSLL